MEKDRTEYFRQYRLNHLEDYKRRSKEFQERQKQGIEAHDEHYYHSIEELKEAEARGEGRINWDKWQEIIDKTKEQFNGMTFQKKQEHQNTNNSAVPKWVYRNSTGQLLGHYQSTKEVMEAFSYLNLTRGVINYYATVQKPYFKQDLYFSNEPIVLKPKKINEASVPRNTAAYDLKTGKLIAVFRTTKEAAEYFNMPPTQVGYVICKRNGVYKRLNLRFEYQSI